MASAPNLTDLLVLDVGHGNTTVIRSTQATVVVDAAPGRTLIDELERDPVPAVDHLILSHADNDHIGGAIAALSHQEFSVSTLWLNPDGVKDSQAWEDLLVFASELHKMGRLKIVMSLNCGTNPVVSSGELEIEVLHPDVILAARGPVAKQGPLGKVTSNGASAVLRIVHSGSPIALLAGDANQFALQRMLEQSTDLTAPLLVFPHHGGHCDGDEYAFAKTLCEAVQPVTVVFSLGRSYHSNPLPEIVRGVRDGAPTARIACTQMSTRCRESNDGLPDQARKATHWLDLPSAGAPRGLRCAGTIHLRASGSSVQVLPDPASHQVFIGLAAPSAMCMAGRDELP